MSDVKAKEIKRAALNEILDYVSSSKGALSDPVYPEIVRMVRPSVCLSVCLSVCVCVCCVCAWQDCPHCDLA